MIELVIGIVVGLVVFSAILMPVVNNAEHAGATQVVNGTTYMHSVNDETTIALSQTTMVIGDQIIEGSGYAPVASDVFWVTMNLASMNIFYYDESTHYGAITGANISINPAEKTIALTNITPAAGSAITETSLNLTYNDFCFVRDMQGDYTCTTIANISDIKINSIDQVYAVGAYSGVYSVSNNVVKTNGVAQEGDAFTVNTTADPELKSIEQNTSVQLSYLIVPAIVYGQSMMSDGVLQMIDVIPILIICGFIISIVANALSRRE